MLFSENINVVNNVLQCKYNVVNNELNSELVIDCRLVKYSHNFFFFGTVRDFKMEDMTTQNRWHEMKEESFLSLFTCFPLLCIKQQNTVQYSKL